jgi:hypothetical protein
VLLLSVAVCPHAPAATPCPNTPPLPPGLKHHLVLPDRRHILTQTTEGHVMLWGVLEGTPIRHYGQVGVSSARWGGGSR